MRAHLQIKCFRLKKINVKIGSEKWLKETACPFQCTDKDIFFIYLMFTLFYLSNLNNYFIPKFQFVKQDKTPRLLFLINIHHYLNKFQCYTIQDNIK